MLDELLTIIRDTTTMTRKGPAVSEAVSEAGIAVMTIDAMPPTPESVAGQHHADVHFVVVVVDMEKAKAARPRLIEILSGFQDVQFARGPSFITIGGALHDQGDALLLLGLGEALRLWSVITPAKMGMHGENGDRMAGSGFVMSDGFRPDAPAP